MPVFRFRVERALADIVALAILGRAARFPSPWPARRGDLRAQGRLLMHGFYVTLNRNGPRARL